MKYSLSIIGFASLLALAACGPAASTGTPATDNAVPAAPSGTVPASNPFDAGNGAATPDASVRVIRIEATNLAFVPSAITAKVGEKVKLELVGVSGNHGIGAKDLGLDVKFDEGQTVTVDLPTNKAGVFPFRCNVQCGDGHSEMTGTITIE